MTNQGEIVPSSVRSRRWPFIVLAAIAVTGGCFCAAGFVMAADFTVADSAHLAHWQRVAIVYLALTVAAVVVLCGALAGLWRTRRVRSAMVGRAT